MAEDDPLVGSDTIESPKLELLIARASIPPREESQLGRRVREYGEASKESFVLLKKIVPYY